MWRRRRRYVWFEFSRCCVLRSYLKACLCIPSRTGIYVPLGILLLQFSPKQASGLSQASIFGASLGGLILNAQNQHPNTNIRCEAGEPQPEGKRALQKCNSSAQDEHYTSSNKFYTRPLINYDMALFLSPLEMSGAVLGILVQKIIPNWLYLLIAGLVLSFTSYKTYRKYFDVRSKEKKQELDAEDANSHEVIQSTIVVGSGVYSDEGNVETTNDDRADYTAAPEGLALARDTDDSAKLRKKYLEEDMRQYPKEKIAALVVLWIGLLILTLLKGGKGVESLVGITCESPIYGVLIALQFCWLFGFAIFYGLKLVKLQAQRVAVEYPYLPDDPIWDVAALRFYGCFTFVAGIVAGFIGIGGGMVLGPLMLIMGIHPRVSTATTATMIVLTSSSVAIIFITSGLVHWSYALFYFLICFIGALVGKTLIDGYIKRTGRASLLIFILATIIAFATVGCFVILFTRLADKNWCLDGFNKFCSTSTGDNDCPIDRMLLSLANVDSVSSDFVFPIQQ